MDEFDTLDGQPWTSPIDRVELEDGTIVLTLNEDARSGQRRSLGPAGQRREAARIITMAWGDRYIADLLAVTIPATLAAGNIPAFSEFFACQFVFVTETRQFEKIASAPVVRRLLQYCDVRLVPIDDLLSSWYGITLTYALVRGFVDLGEAMTETHLVFLNADFIVADGSYRKLAEAIRRGERLVVSPSYCMVLEKTIEQLQSRYDEETCSLAVTPRQMAAMIIEHRHNTIRAKTINQRMFRIHRYDQFYWYVDDTTLLARQMPIAVVYMRPERVVTEMPTFWDYGVISEYCPSTVPCVLGDSDDFLMGELRTAGTFRELLHLGWPSPEEIAADLSSFTTKDHRDYGRHTLVLHSQDLPAGIAEEKHKFSAFVDDIYRRLTPPISYVDHPFWADAFPRFASTVAENGRKLRLTLQAKRALQGLPEGLAATREMQRLEAKIADAEGQYSALLRALKAEDRMQERDLSALATDYEQKCALIVQEHNAALGRSELGPLQDKIAKLHDEREAIAATLRQRVEREVERQLGSPGEGSLIGELAPFASTASRGRSARSSAPRGGRAIAPSREARKTIVSRVVPSLSRLYRRIFGQVPRTRRWHPYYSLLQPVFSEIMSGETRIATALVVSSSGVLGPLLVKPLTARKTSLTPGMLAVATYQESLDVANGFDLCLLDLSLEDLRNAASLLHVIRPHMAVDGKIIVFHHNLTNQNLDHLTYELTEKAFPIFGASQIIFTGSRLGALAVRWFNHALNKYNIYQLKGLAAVVAIVSAGGVVGRLGSWLEQKRSAQRMPDHCTSMTIVIDLGGGRRNAAPQHVAAVHSTTVGQVSTIVGAS